MTAIVSGTFTGTGTKTFDLAGRANLWLSGGVGTVKVQASYDAGATWFDVGRDGSGVFVLTASVAFVDFMDEIEGDLTYRLNCSTYTSGTITYRVSK